LSEQDWSLAAALWKREGWQIVEAPDLHETYTADGWEHVEGIRLVSTRGLDRVEVVAPTQKRARVMLFAKMEGLQ
jgi:uncharacterized lipoprotein